MGAIRRRELIGMAGGLLVIACVTNDSPPSGALPYNFTATIGGAGWGVVGAGATFAADADSALTLQDTDNIDAPGFTLELWIGGFTGLGAYPLNSGQLHSRFGALTLNGKYWNSDYTGGGAADTVFVTSYSSTHVGGTFKFVGGPDPSTGASGTQVVTNGTFNVTIVSQ